MITKMKKCAGCGLDKYIWKNINGKKYCKECSTGVIPVKKAKPISDIRNKRLTAYNILKDTYMESHKICEGRLPGCTITTRLQLHHTKGRENDLLTDTRYFKVLCHNCHTYCTEHSLECLELNLSQSRNKINNDNTNTADQ